MHGIMVRSGITLLMIMQLSIISILEHVFNVAASGTANNQITFSEAMRIDNSGNMETTASPTQKLDVRGNVYIGSRELIQSPSTICYIQ